MPANPDNMPDCIVVAAGRSQRMGSWKPALPWRGGTVLTHTVSRALEAGCRVVLVGGYRFEELKRLVHECELLANAGRAGQLVLAHAPDWQEGMDASCRRGMSLVSGSGFFILPGDMPLVRPEDFHRLHEVFTASEAGCVRPVYGGVPGHPVLLSSRLKNTLLHGAPGEPFHTLLREEGVTLLEWPHSGVVEDIDTPENYRRLTAGRLSDRP